MKRIAVLIFGNVKLGRDLKLLLLIGGLYALSVALSNTFVNVYLWKQKSDYMTIALYNLFIVIAQPVIFTLGGRWAKQVDRVIVLRLGVFFLSVFYLIVLLLGDVATTYVVVLGILLGVGNGFYWLAFNVLTFEITEPDTRDIFNGFFGLLGSFAGMLGPFFAGWLITQMEGMRGYSVIFGLSLGLFVTAVVLSFFLNRRSARGRFELKHVLKWSEISGDWKRVLLANATHGFREGSFPFLIGIWIFVATGTELALGTYSLITSAISFIVFYCTGRFISHKYRMRSILIGSICLALAVWIIAFELTFTRLMIFGGVVSIAFPILMVPFNSMTLDVIGKAKNAADWRIEYIVGREWFTNVGRVISILFFMGVVSLFEAKKALPYFILIVGNAHLFLYFLMRKVKIESKGIGFWHLFKYNK